MGLNVLFKYYFCLSFSPRLFLVSLSLFLWRVVGITGPEKFKTKQKKTIQILSSCASVRVCKCMCECVYECALIVFVTEASLSLSLSRSTPTSTSLECVSVENFTPWQMHALRHLFSSCVVVVVVIFIYSSFPSSISISSLSDRM